MLRSLINKSCQRRARRKESLCNSSADKVLNQLRQEVVPYLRHAIEKRFGSLYRFDKPGSFDLNPVGEGG